MKNNGKHLCLLLLCLALVMCFAVSCSSGSADVTTEAEAQQFSASDPGNFVFTKDEYEGTEYYTLTGITEQGKTLTTLDVPQTYDGLTVLALDSACFDGCDKLETVIIHSSVLEFYANLFPGCTALRTVKLDFGELVSKIYDDGSIAEDLVCATATDGTVTGDNSILQGLDESKITLLFTDSEAYYYFRADYTWGAYASIMKLEEEETEAESTTEADITESTTAVYVTTEKTETTAAGTTKSEETTTGADGLPSPVRAEDNAGVTNVSPTAYASETPAANQTLIIYDYNGGSAGSSFGTSGTVSDSATGKICVTRHDGYFTQYVTDSVYLCPHAMGDKGYLVREGYVLYGYNTKADGSGDYYGCGWNIPIEKGEKIVLYAQWAKETASSDFTISGTKLTAYKGSDTRVVIPAGITEISAGAFKNLSSLETVIMPTSITTINAGAFNNCPKLRVVYQFDKITSMPTDSFKSCDAFDTLRINNANNIKYMGTMKQGSYMIKFQRLLLKKDQKKIIMIGGSNLLYGVYSATIKEELGNEYEIINYGTMYQSPASFYVDLCSNFIVEGDIILTCPEEEPWQWGQVNTTETGTTYKYGAYLMYFCEGCMEVFSYSDMSRYRNLLPEIASANKARASGTSSYESAYKEAMNEYGDYDFLRETQTNQSKWSNSTVADYYGASRRAKYFTASNVANLNRAFDACKAKGAIVFISYSACDSQYVTDYSEATLAAYDQAVYDNFVAGHTGTYLISKVADYVFDNSYFYNSMHHMLSAGQKLRTERLCADIKAQLAKLK